MSMKLLPLFVLGTCFTLLGVAILFQALEEFVALDLEVGMQFRWIDEGKQGLPLYPEGSIMQIDKIDEVMVEYHNVTWPYLPTAMMHTFRFEDAVEVLNQDRKAHP